MEDVNSEFGDFFTVCLVSLRRHEIDENTPVFFVYDIFAYFQIILRPSSHGDQ